MNTNKKGFTLIELLIVIAIIGILAGVVLAVINPQQQRNRATEASARSLLSKACLVVTACINASSTGTCANTSAEMNTLTLPTGVTWAAAAGSNINPSSAVSATTANTIGTVAHGDCTLTCSLATGSITPSGTCVSN